METAVKATNLKTRINTKKTLTGDFITPLRNACKKSKSKKKVPSK